MRFSEDTLVRWTAPASDTEEEKMDRTISMVKNAITACAALDEFDIEIFVQGSYENSTNVKNDSDVDVCVMSTASFFTDYPTNKTQADYGHENSAHTFNEYKSLVLDALQDEFGRDSVSIGNKSIKISSNTYHVHADVVPAFLLKDYEYVNGINPDDYCEGIRFVSKDGLLISNYPKMHIKNGREKNKRTGHQYKYLVRIFKRIRNAMADESLIDRDTITSYLLECLIWNIPDSIINTSTTWTDTLQQSLTSIYRALEDESIKKWTEVSGVLMLFQPSRKWTIQDVRQFVFATWDYLGY